LYENYEAVKPYIYGWFGFLEHPNEGTKVLPLSSSAELARRRVRVVNDLCGRRNPERQAPVRERARQLDVVEEDRVPLVEDVIFGETRAPQKQAARRRLRHRARLGEIVVEHPVVAEPPLAARQEPAGDGTTVGQRHLEGWEPEVKRLR
jgi:hypothetical protein